MVPPQGFVYLGPVTVHPATPRRMIDLSEQNPGARFLLVAACAVVVAWGLQFAAPIMLPFALALFLSVLTLPVLVFLREKRVPTGLAVLIAMAVVVGTFVLIGLMASQSAGQLEAVLPGYARRLGELQTSWFNSLEARFPNRDLSEYVSLSLFDPSSVVDLVTSTIGRAASLVSQGFLVFLIMFFILAESTVFPAKLAAILGGSIKGEEGMRKVVAEVQTYLGIKTAMSLLTGVLIGVWAWITGLDLPIVLGLIAFVLNYIPTVGSIIAAVPAVLLSLILVGTVSHALLVALGYVLVNTVFGNIIEPNLMGRRLGLSTLVVIMSLLFWGWTWGPVGALLSVPLTMVLKIWLENTRDLRWVAILLDKQSPMVPLTDPIETPAALTMSLDPAEFRR